MNTYANEAVKYNDVAGLEALFLGRKISWTEFDRNGDLLFVLDNAVKVRLIPNDGCGGCSNGNFAMTDYTAFDHAITGVKVLDDSKDGNGGATIELFVYGEGISEKVATVKGDEGNGYYGRGFTLAVIPE